MKLKYICDNRGHLICVPYSIENLHIMADQLSIKNSMFYQNHYDMPAKRINEIKKLCQVVSLSEIIEIILSPEYADVILSDEIKGGVSAKDYFLQTQLQYEGYGNR